MATDKRQPATNERIVRLLEEVRSALGESKRREEQMARNLDRLLKQKPA